CLPLQKYHTPPEFQASTIAAGTRALAFLAATVRPHGRGECSCEREPRPSDHPRPGLLFGPLTGVRPAIRSASGSHRPTPDLPAAISFHPILTLGAPSAD